MQCKYSAVAVDDLIGIAQYIARDNPKRAGSFTAELRACCSALARQPGMGRLRPDLGTDVRLFPHGNYVILFSALNDGGVCIERVLHGARDLPLVVNYVGATQGLYGKDAAKVAQYLEEERNSWDRKGEKK
jgi:toxin ParE1/3/4